MFFFLPDHEIHEFELIPSAKHFECQKHLVSSDCPNHWPAAETAEGTRIMWEIVKAEFPEKQQKAIKQLKEKCPKFYDTYFVPTVQPKLEKVSFCKIKEVFTAGASASSFVESMNSSMGRWFLSSSNSFVEVITCCLQKDAQNIREKQQALGIVNLNTNGLTIDTDFEVITSHKNFRNKRLKQQTITLLWSVQLLCNQEVQQPCTSL